MAFSRVRDPSVLRPSERYGDRADAKRADQTLIVTYMTATGARRTLAMPRRRIYGVVAVLACSTIWSVASAAWLVVRLADSARVAVTATSATAPAEVRVAGSAASAGALADVAPAAASRTAPMSVVSVGDAVIAAAPAVAASEAAPSSPAAVPSAPAVAVTGFHVDRIGRAIVASFNVENRGAGVAAGRVWGVATFALETGETIAVASHAGVNPKVPAVAAEGGVTFSARVRTAKELSFHVPANAKDVASIAVYVGSKTAEQPLVATYSPNQESGAAAVWR